MDNKNIMIVDDSALMRRLESDIISSDGRFIIAKACTNGLEAYDEVTRNPSKYDIILMDIYMPKMTGLEFLAAIQKHNLRVKVILISTAAVQDSKETIRALQLGAFDYLEKPESFAQVMGQPFKQKVLEKVLLAAGLQEVSLFGDKPKPSPVGTVTGAIKVPVEKPVTSEDKHIVSPMNAREILANIKTPRRPHVKVSASNKRLVLIASSTGGPKALHEVIPLLPQNLNAPVLIVQHMAAGFTNSLAVRLNQSSKLNVVEANGGEKIAKGFVYIAQGGTQMRLKKVGSDYIIDINPDEPPRNALKPCADILFESIAGMDFDDITCCVMTGMGGDGTMGIKALTDKNNVYVIAQDESTSTVYGMPKVVYEAGLTDVVKPLSQLADEITKNTGVLQNGC